MMRFLLAVLLPFTVFFTIGRPLAGILCLVMQVFVVGWPFAALWAVYALSNYNADQKIKAMRTEILEKTNHKR